MWLLLILAVIIGGFLFYAAQKPGTFRYTRSIEMAATPDKIFPHVNTLRLWHDWSPWAKLDPNSKTTFEGPESGVNAHMHWSGNNKIGEGSMTIVESNPNAFIKMRLNFMRPFKTTHSAEFNFQNAGATTKVTWTNYGTYGLMGKAIGILMNCEKMMNAQFDKGLTSLKGIVESK